MRPDDAPAWFDDPWHAQLFGLTVALAEAGRFSWPEWTAALGAAIARAGATRPTTGGTDYFAAWLDALEDLLARKGLASAEEAEAMRAAWESAYLTTPHGEPVRLPG